MEFVKENINPKGWKTNDCVIRAIAKATNKSWEEVYKDLSEIGLKKCRMPNDKIVYELYLKNNGWIKEKMPKHYNGTRYTTSELVDELTNEEIIISVAHHLTFARKGTLYDIWDCRRKSVGNYWRKGE